MPRIASYANIASTLALVVALSGTAYAATTITGKDVKNGSLTGKDVKSKSLTGKDVKDKSIRSADIGRGLLPGASAAILSGSETTIPAGQINAYVFDTEVYDNAKMFESGAYIRVPRTGIYELTATVGYYAAGQYQRQTRILVDGEIVALGILTVDGATNAVPVTITLPLQAGARVSLGTYNGGSAAQMAEFSGTSPDAVLTVQMVSP